MRKLKTHSKSGLFVMEMILSLLFLALTVSVCIRIFAASRANETTARSLNHIQELTVRAGEILEGTDGSAEQFLALFPGGALTDGSLVYCFDSQWNICAADDFVYRLTVTLTGPSSGEKKAGLSFLDQSGEILSETEIRFPVLSGDEEGVS